MLAGIELLLAERERDPRRERAVVRLEQVTTEFAATSAEITEARTAQQPV